MQHWVCMATYNERDNIADLLQQLRSTAPDGHVIVVDDNSPDGTGELLDELAGRDDHIHPVHRSGKLGYASAHRAAMAQALDCGADVVVTMDADFSHDPKHLPDLMGLIEQGADVAIGSRYVAGGRTENWPWCRRFLSSAANALARAGLGLAVHDCTSGYRAYRTSLMRRLDLGAFRSEGYCFLEELLVQCHLAGADIRETPIVFVERRAGRSKMSRRVIFEAAWVLAKLSFRRVLGRRGMA
jgi:dolichol-phosphate mannosyltransferase